ncbi:MAG: formylglycine-generating enzyme family protein [Treponema sp.]|jgi:formylglycine-generating enzyme required for sulfatase activity|nr:formylglycine-generating enzyme family protein [Treponema sp.]
MKKTVFKVVITFCFAIAMILGSCGDEDNNDNNMNNNNGNNGGGGIIEMINVSGGSFQMGQNGNGSSGNETPVHQVTLTQKFYIGKYEVTQKQWLIVMGSLPSELTTGTNYGRGDNYPVYYVSWYDALVFCNKLSILEGLTPAYSIDGKIDPDEWGPVPTKDDVTWNAVEMAADSNGYRLPTEAQWEYAAKGGSSASNPYRIYSGSDTAGNVAWYKTNSGNKTHEVGKKAANELGIYDMSGNVLEWCWDWNGAYPSEAQTDPLGASSGTMRIYRGGVWFDPIEYLPSVERNHGSPFMREEGMGFRIARP